MKKTVLITGASRGIGAETARLFASNEYNVVINYNNSEKRANDLITELNSLGYSVVSYKADVSSYDDVKKMIEYVLSVYGKIDVLVNNAAIAEIKPFIDVSEKDFDKIMNINLKGTFNTCSAVVPHMISNKYGKIVNISSVWGKYGSSCEVVYSTSKAALFGFTKALAKELAPSNINVNCVAPGLIDTEMNSDINKGEIEKIEEEIAMGRMGTTREIANVIFFLASDLSSYINGDIISPTGAWK